MVVMTEFIKVCGVLKRGILEDMASQHQMPQEAIDWVEQVSQLATVAAMNGLSVPNPCGGWW